MTRPKIIIAPCVRCGKEVCSLSRSLYGLDELKAKTGVICSACATSEEKMALAMEMGRQLSH